MICRSCWEKVIKTKLFLNYAPTNLTRSTQNGCEADSLQCFSVLRLILVYVMANMTWGYLYPFGTAPPTIKWLFWLITSERHAQNVWNSLLFQCNISIRMINAILRNLVCVIGTMPGRNLKAIGRMPLCDQNNNNNKKIKKLLIAFY